MAYLLSAAKELITSCGSSFFLGKVTALGVLCYFALFVCLTLLASFFLPSHLSFKNMYTMSGDSAVVDEWLLALPHSTLHHLSQRTLQLCVGDGLQLGV